MGWYIYNGFAIMPDLRQTCMKKKPGHFLAKTFPVNLYLFRVNFFAKNQISASFGFSVIVFQIYREFLKKYRKRLITL